uniref:Uncharacterized protein n=1 Tax=Ditylenchus dipsaci TaxID=166011 RepID=A0A915DJX2_9BILA
MEPEADEKNSKGRNAAKAQVAARKRQLAMERMKQLQKSFKKMCVNTDITDNSAEMNSGMDDEEDMGLCADDDSEQGKIHHNAGFPVCCGPNQTVVQSKTQRKVISFDANHTQCPTTVGIA